MRFFLTGIGVACLTFAACAGSRDIQKISALDRYEPAIRKCTEMSDMDMQSCLADLNSKAVAEEEQMFGSSTDVGCQAKAKRFEEGTGYWSSVYICSIKERARKMDARKR